MWHAWSGVVTHEGSRIRGVLCLIGATAAVCVAASACKKDCDRPLEDYDTEYASVEDIGTAAAPPECATLFRCGGGGYALLGGRWSAGTDLYFSSEGELRAASIYSDVKSPGCDPENAWYGERVDCEPECVIEAFGGCYHDKEYDAQYQAYWGKKLGFCDSKL